MTDRPGYSFDPGPPEDASRFLRNKGMKPAFSWADVEPEEHAVAFTVAKAMQADVLTSIREAVQRALDEGQTFETFKRDLTPTLQRLGWWGETTMVDLKSRDPREVQLGSPRRLRTIYDANLRSARAAGQWERIQRTKDVRPYLVYELGPSERRRPHHVDKQGLVLSVDDTFWLVWMPPNGWGCKCRVRQIGRAEAERLGIREAPNVEMRPFKNFRTGEVRQVPQGIDPGWDTNPGALRMRRMSDMLAEKLTAAHPQVARVIARDLASSWRMARLQSGDATGKLTLTAVPRELSERLGTTAGSVGINETYARKIAQRSIDGPLLAQLLDQIWQGGKLALETSGQSRKLHVFAKADRRTFRVIIKVLGTEMWLVSAYRVDTGSDPQGEARRRAFLSRPGVEDLE
ncbi:MAG: phage minor head protein [Pseudomonadota bacterium]